MPHAVAAIPSVTALAASELIDQRRAERTADQHRDRRARSAFSTAAALMRRRCAADDRRSAARPIRRTGSAVTVGRHRAADRYRVNPEAAVAAVAPAGF